MGFKFSHLCDLLSSLENNRILKATTEAKNHDPDDRTVTQWFKQHGKRLRDKDTDQLAVLSCLFPEKRTDRVYRLQDTSLARVVGRCLLLGSSRREELDRWRISGGIDLAQCVENVMRQAENHIPEGQSVTVEEIDAALTGIASRCRYSGPRVRRQRAAVDVDEALSPLYRRLSSRDAKWLTRMILKSYLPVVLPQNLALRSFHFLLPHLLLFQDSFEATLGMLASEPISHFPPHPEPGLARDLGLIAVQHLSPVIGVKIGRPDYYKARSIKHCCKMIGRRRMSMERKYDGEYCQIHIDLSKHASYIQIFSKSGRDSTADRSGIHQVIRDSLRIGKPGCRFTRRCILEGELLVWSDQHGKIMGFHKLRKFITRSGTFLGTESDSPPQPYERLMIVFFDVLLLDDNICLKYPHRERRLLLKDAIQVIAGRADISEQRVIDFSRPGSQSQLESTFSTGVAERWEGFVLKGCEDPYFTIFPSQENSSMGRWIKLKKDYIPGLGDTVDLTIIGGRYDSRDAVGLKQINKLLWTHFFIGCLVNKESVLQSKSKPKFRVVDVINRHCMSAKNMQILNQFGEYSACGIDSGPGFDIEYGTGNLPCVDIVFKTPFVVEMLGSGFEKPSGARYYALRFPRILKIHWDRSFEDAASFSELQLLAEDARSVPTEELTQEEGEWNKRLKLGNGSSEYIVNRSQSLLSTTSSSSKSTQSPVKGHLSDGRTVHEAPVNGSSVQGYTSGPMKTSDEKAQATTRPIPIFVDETIACMSFSSDEFCIHGNFLSNNNNLSSHQREKEGFAAECSLKRKHSNPIDDSENTYTSAYSDISVTLAHSSSTQGSQVSETHADPPPELPITHNPKPYKTIKSLLPTLPTLPIHHLSASDTPSFDTFLQGLFSNPSTPENPLTVALILLNPNQTPLGPTLLSLTTHLSKRLQNQPLISAQNGKIFLLDSTFINLSADRVYPPVTWEAIGRKYFYACVSWSTGVEKGKVDKILCTPMEGRGRGCERGGCDGVLTGRGLVDRVSIGFDRRALGVLESTVSMERGRGVF
ncbi:hypothetical protein BBP40_010078 [Aspergillus hancockii]|nr:hypothetical protein BBP40_010078 [Aspergillus hancockii]